MSIEQNCKALSELFEKLIMNPRVDVCTGELKGASVLDVNILRLLKKRGNLSIKQLGSVLVLPPSTLGGAIKRLEKNHLIERKINSDDLRSYIICLSEHGDEVICKTYKEQEKIMAALLGTLNEKEQEILLELLQRMFLNF